MKKWVLTSALLAITGVAQAQSSRNTISIVGSSTVYPFASLVAEHFGQTTSFGTPTIESTGSGGGFRLFCAGIGPQHPDITNSSRAIKSSEIETCKKNGIDEITEVRFGYDGIVLANSAKAEKFTLTNEQIWKALASQVPAKDGSKLVANYYKNWSEIDSSLPNQKIEVLGPPPTSGTRDAFVELAMDSGCKQIELVKQLKGDAKKAACSSIRTDGAYIEAGENDNLIVNRLVSDPVLVGIFGYSFLEENADKIQAATINGAEASFENIASGDYPLSRPLFFYVKNAHLGLIAGLKEYVESFISEEAAGESGYLTGAGLVTLSGSELESVQSKIKGL